MKKFTDIGQFREVIRGVKQHHDYKGKDENGDVIYNHDSPYPTLEFTGTVKLHGTNAGIAKYPDGHYEFQSRERTLSLQSDNAQFMVSMLNKPYQDLFEGIEFKDHCIIYGEWCGQEIQKGVAIAQLPKMFVIFSIRIDDVYYDIRDFVELYSTSMETKYNQFGIYSKYQFENYSVFINFEHPELVQNTLIKLTEEVEKQCPVGKYFGVEGIGEGIVWEHINGPLRYIFKVKGEKHQSSKVKTLAPVDTEEIENINQFVEYAVTESRLSQGIDKMKEMNIPLEMKSTGEYLRWVYNDIVKEETDTIVKNCINVKKIGSAVAAKAKIYWLDYLKNNAQV